MISLLWADASPFMHYEVRAYYKHGVRSTLVYADSAKAAIEKARAELRGMMPKGQRITSYLAVPN
jgi:hypothetical protein